MRVVLVVLLAACHSASPATPRPPSEADIVARSHAVLDAFDHGDVAAATATLSPSYVHFEGSYLQRDKELALLANRSPTAPRIGTRTWTDERAFVRPGDALFIGKASEHMAGNDVHGGYLFEGWYTLGWTREGDAWKLVFWGWQPSGGAAKSVMWNQIFHNAIGFNHEPNRLLVETVKSIKPGAALDVAMGQGRNALYLASQGWQVTGVDISDEGIRQAREAATQRKLALDAIDADLETYDFGSAKWDLVTMIYAGSDAKRIAKIQAAVRPGGMFIYEYFTANPKGGEADDDGVVPGALAKQFAGWEILRDDVAEDVPDWAMDRAKLQRFVARKR
jgi:SAM-dependent methyltransferase